MWVKETLKELAIKIYFTKDGINKISFLPIITENISQPTKANNDDAEKILQRLAFPLEITEDGEKYVIAN
jgi:hypothetical protein